VTKGSEALMQHAEDTTEEELADVVKKAMNGHAQTNGIQR